MKRGLLLGSRQLLIHLADPSGIELFAGLLDADGALGAIVACESLLPG